MSLNGVNNIVTTNDSTTTAPAVTTTTTDEEINSTFTDNTTDTSASTDSSVFSVNDTVNDVAVGLSVEDSSEATGTETNHKPATRPVSQFEIQSYLRNPGNIESDQYQRALDEINKLQSKSSRTTAEDIRLQNLHQDLKTIKQRVKYKLMSSNQENPDIVEKNGAKKLLTVELLNTTNAKKVDNQETDDPNDTKDQLGNIFGIKLTGMYNKNGTTAGMDVTVGNEYLLNASLEHIKNSSTFGVNASAEITNNSDIDASAHAYYTYTKGLTEFSAKGNYNVYSSNVEGERLTFQEGDISANIDTPHFGASASADFTELGNTYGINLRGSYSKEWKNGVSFDGNFNGGYEYVDKFNAHSVQAGANARINYADENIRGYVALDARGNYTDIKSFDYKDYNVSGTIDCGISAKNLDFHTNYTYERGNNQSGLQYGLGLGYTFNSGIGVIADYGGSIMLTGGEANAAAKAPAHKVNVRLKAPVGQYLDKLLTLKQDRTAAKAENMGL